MSHANEVLRQTDGGICPTLQSRMGTGGNQVPLVFDKAYCIAGNVVDRSETAGANGIGVKEDCSYTLNTVDRHAIVYALDRAAFNQGENAKYDFLIDDSGKNSTLTAKGPSAVCHYIARLFRWVVRRLTPRECERLQGFPDDWTKYDTHGNEIKDCHRYKALGNSIATPCALRVFEGILDVERE